MRIEAPDRTSVDLPADLSEEERRQLQDLAARSEAISAPFPIDELFIRHWCETLEDGNPLYLDDDCARAHGFDGLLLPPAALYSSVIPPFRWPWPPKQGAAPMIHFRVKEILKLPVAIATDVDMVTFRPVQCRQRTSSSSRLVSVSSWKKTRLGEGRFFTYALDFWNEKHERIAEIHFGIYGYGRGPALSAPPKGGYSNAIEETLKGDQTSYQPSVSSGLYWEDVNEGDILPQIRMPITLTRCVMMASATRDFSPQHSHSDYARQRSGARDVFVNTPFNMGMVSRLVTDWAGPLATVRRIKVSMKLNVCAGDEMLVTGRVSRKYSQDGERRVDLEVMICNQDGPATPCQATIALPQRPATAGK